jgi:hypothetical protein
MLNVQDRDCGTFLRIHPLKLNRFINKQEKLNESGVLQKQIDHIGLGELVDLITNSNLHRHGILSALHSDLLFLHSGPFFVPPHFGFVSPYFGPPVTDPHHPLQTVFVSFWHHYLNGFETQAPFRTPRQRAEKTGTTSR